MANIPAEVLEKMNAQGTVKVLVTASDCGQPHAIVCGSIMAPSPDKMLVGEILMHKSAENMKANPKAAFLITAGKDAWEIDVKNPTRIAEGPQLEEMNKNLAGAGLKANALWLFDVDAVYDEGAGPNAGKKIA